MDQLPPEIQNIQLGESIIDGAITLYEIIRNTPLSELQSQFPGFFTSEEEKAGILTIIETNIIKPVATKLETIVHDVRLSKVMARYNVRQEQILGKIANTLHVINELKTTMTRDDQVHKSIVEGNLSAMQHQQEVIDQSIDVSQQAVDLKLTQRERESLQDVEQQRVLEMEETNLTYQEVLKSMNTAPESLESNEMRAMKELKTMETMAKKELENNEKKIEKMRAEYQKLKEQGAEFTKEGVNLESNIQIMEEEIDRLPSRLEELENQVATFNKILQYYADISGEHQRMLKSLAELGRSMSGGIKQKIDGLIELYKVFQHKYFSLLARIITVHHPDNKEKIGNFFSSSGEISKDLSGDKSEIVKLAEELQTNITDALEALEIEEGLKKADVISIKTESHGFQQTRQVIEYITLDKKYMPSSFEENLLNRINKFMSYDNNKLKSKQPMLAIDYEKDQNKMLPQDLIVLVINKLKDLAQEAGIPKNELDLVKEPYDSNTIVRLYGDIMSQLLKNPVILKLSSLETREFLDFLTDDELTFNYSCKGASCTKSRSIDKDRLFRVMVDFFYIDVTDLVKAFSESEFAPWKKRIDIDLDFSKNITKDSNNYNILVNRLNLYLQAKSRKGGNFITDVFKKTSPVSTPSPKDPAASAKVIVKTPSSTTPSTISRLFGSEAKGMTLLPVADTKDGERSVIFISGFIRFLKESLLVSSHNMASFISTMIALYVIHAIAQQLLPSLIAFANDARIVNGEGSTFESKITKFLIQRTPPVLTYIKVRIDPDKVGSISNYNKRFNVFTSQDHRKLRVKYNDDNFPYYNEGELSQKLENPIIDSTKGIKKFSGSTVMDFTVNKYDYSYVFGPFTRIFHPKLPNSKIADYMFEVRELLKNKKKVFIMGYGASGAGKTSTLIYFNKKQLNGILPYLCNSMGNDYPFIKVSAYEWYDLTGRNGMPEPRVTISKDGKEHLIFQFTKSSVETWNKEGNFVLVDNYKHKNLFTDRVDSCKDKTKDPSIQPDCDFTTFDTPEKKVLGNVLIHLIDNDRFVKATTNNPNSSRSHAVIIIEFMKSKEISASSEDTPALIIGDFAGVENEFQCGNPDVLKQFMNIKIPDFRDPSKLSNKLFYKVYSIDDKPREQPNAQADIPMLPPTPTPSPRGGSRSKRGGGKMAASCANLSDSDMYTFSTAKFEREFESSATVPNPERFNKYFEACPKFYIRVEQMLINFHEVEDIPKLGAKLIEAADKGEDELIKLQEIILKDNIPKLQRGISFQPHKIRKTPGDKSDASKWYDSSVQALSTVLANFFTWVEEASQLDDNVDILISLFQNTVKRPSYTGDGTLPMLELLKSGVNYAEDYLNPDIKNIKIKDQWRNFLSSNNTHLERPICIDTYTNATAKMLVAYNKDMAPQKNESGGSSTREQRVKEFWNSFFDRNKDVKLHVYPNYVKGKCPYTLREEIGRKEIMELIWASLFDQNEAVQLITGIRNGLRAEDGLAKLENLCNNVKTLYNDFFPQDAETDLKPSNQADMEIIIKTIDGRLESLFADFVCKYPMAYKLCNLRTNEGKFINNSLAQIREIVRYVIAEKSKSAINMIPAFDEGCLGHYCNKDTCFPVSKVPLSLAGNAMIKQICKVLKLYDANGRDDPTKLTLCLFCVLNLSHRANNPPPIPYIDCNKLKKLYLDISSIVRNRNRMTAEEKKALEQLLPTFVEEFKKVIEKIEHQMKDDAEDKTNEIKVDIRYTNARDMFYPDFKKKGAEPFYNKGITESLMNAFYDLLKTFFEVIDRSNAASAIGTLEFMDNVSKYYLSKYVCHEDTKLESESTLELACEGEICTPCTEECSSSKYEAVNQAFFGSEELTERNLVYGNPYPSKPTRGGNIATYNAIDPEQEDALTTMTTPSEKFTINVVFYDHDYNNNINEIITSQQLQNNYKLLDQEYFKQIMSEEDKQIVIKNNSWQDDSCMAIDTVMNMRITAYKLLNNIDKNSHYIIPLNKDKAIQCFKGKFSDKCTEDKDDLFNYKLYKFKQMLVELNSVLSDLMNNFTINVFNSPFTSNEFEMLKSQSPTGGMQKRTQQKKMKKCT